MRCGSSKWKRDEQEETGNEIICLSSIRHTTCSKSVWKTQLQGTGVGYIKQIGTMKKRCLSAEVMDQRKELDDTVEKFKRRLGQFGY